MEIHSLILFLILLHLYLSDKEYLKIYRERNEELRKQNQMESYRLQMRHKDSRPRHATKKEILDLAEELSKQPVEYDRPKRS